MKHDEYKQYRCDKWDISCLNCINQDCLNNPEYEVE